MESSSIDLAIAALSPHIWGVNPAFVPGTRKLALFSINIDNARVWAEMAIL
jgi:hypothetical protein